MIRHLARAQTAVFAAMLITLVGLGPALAVDGKDSSDPVVAVVNGELIHRSEVVAIHDASQARQSPLESVYDQVLDYVIASHLMVAEATKQNLQDTTAVKAAFKNAQDQILAQAYMNEKLKSAISDDDVKKRYDELIKTMPPKEEIHARHILLDSEDAAKKVIADLKGGAKFEDEAKAKSKDPSAQTNGGELGFFSKDDMVAEFADAAFKMKDGEISATPVKTQFGWHVIQVIGRRPAAPPTFDEVKPQIEAQLRGQAAQKIVDDLEKPAQIKRLNIDGTARVPAPPAAKPAP
jgi:peptidyl-prolyl cis-trans isomerase C